MIENFDQPIKLMKVLEKIRKVVIGQKVGSTADRLLYYPYFKNDYRFVAVDLSKQQAFNTNPKAK